MKRQHKQVSRNLRHNQTDAESLVWRHMRNRNLVGHKFRRQHAIGPYVVDFVCIEKHLVVEIDGGQHTENAEIDEKRSAFLRARGFKVLRFWNHEVLRNVESVLEAIWQQLDAPSPQPSPATSGRGSVDSAQIDPLSPEKGRG